MHRSGTSCLAGCLENSGLHLGKVVERNWDNAKGNRENLEIRAINDDVIRLSGGTWDKPPGAIIWDASLAQRRDLAIEARTGIDQWGFKDPRTLLTLPFWLEAIPDMRLVGTFRHPLAAAFSMSERDNTEVCDALELWNIHNEKLLQYLSEFDFPVVCFDWPAGRYTQAIQSVAAKLEIRANAACPSDTFFEDTLRTSQNYPKSLRMSTRTEAIYTQLMAQCSG